VSRPTQKLPEREAEVLRELREAGANALPLLRARVFLLRDGGWSLAAVGAPLGANRSTTRMWQTSAKPEDVKRCLKQHGKPTVAPPRSKTAKVVRLYPDVPEADRAKLVKLAESARRVRGWTPQDAPERKDASEFEKLLRMYHEERGVPMKRLAEHIGVTHRAIAARLERADERALQVAS
jgi:hypothetical protein